MDFFFCSGSDSHQLLAPPPVCISSIGGEKSQTVKTKAMHEAKTNVTESLQG